MVEGLRCCSRAVLPAPLGHGDPPAATTILAKDDLAVQVLASLPPPPTYGRCRGTRTLPGMAASGSSDLRAWTSEQGMKVSASGRLPQQVVAAYKTVHSDLKPAKTNRTVPLKCRKPPRRIRAARRTPQSRRPTPARNPGGDPRQIARSSGRVGEAGPLAHRTTECCSRHADHAQPSVRSPAPDVVVRLTSNKMPPARTSRSSSDWDVWQPGGPAPEALSMMSHYLRRDILGSSPVLECLVPTAFSQQYVWLAAPTDAAHRAVGTTPGVRVALHGGLKVSEGATAPSTTSTPSRHDSLDLRFSWLPGEPAERSAV